MSVWPGPAPSAAFGLGDNVPAYFLSWTDAQDFVFALNAYIQATSQGPASFRLPTEAEWEYACRAGSQTRFFFGDSLGCADNFSDCAAGAKPGNRTDYMWYNGNNGSSGTPQYGVKPAGLKLPNDFGLYDMSGNLWEWCQDRWHEDYVGAPSDGSSWTEGGGADRVLRGGARRRGASVRRAIAATPDFASCAPPIDWLHRKDSHPARVCRVHALLRLMRTKGGLATCRKTLGRSKNPRLLAVRARLSQTTRQPSSANYGGQTLFDRLLAEAGRIRT
ncbi:MAG: Formylglycine-generating sulfatase enzyme [candidate division BRC1 bacterium ADurb.BinA364]|nr:MAG: Formylglycine-generating sulfatase enzyme [candidate division BRC1 bacterium ADurb.BinA364]